MLESILELPMGVRYAIFGFGIWIDLELGAWRITNIQILLSSNHLYIFLCSEPDPLSGSLCYPVFGSCECLSMTGKSEQKWPVATVHQAAIRKGNICKEGTYTTTFRYVAAASLGDTRVIVVARTHVRTSESNRIESNLSLPSTRRPRLIFTVAADAAAAEVVIVL